MTENKAMKHRALAVDYVNESLTAIAEMFENKKNTIVQIAEDIVNAHLGKRRIYIFGNGGSAAQAQHWAAELVGRFSTKRTRPISAQALSVDTSILTAVGNDSGFETVFARQIEAHGRPGDLAIGLSTSGTSRNVIKAINEAFAIRMGITLLTGQEHTEFWNCCDNVLSAPSEHTAIIQDCHQVAIHCIMTLVDDILAYDRPISDKPNHERNHENG